jgi:hypothetical protein
MENAFFISPHLQKKPLCDGTNDMNFWHQHDKKLCGL